MRHAGLSVIRVLVPLSLSLVVLVIGLISMPSSATAAASLNVTVQKGLSVLSESEAVTITGPVGLLPSSGSDAPEAQVVVRLRGPATISQVRDGGLRPDVAAEAEHDLLPEDVAAAGSLEKRIVIPFDSVIEPGAYLVEVELTAGSEVLASGAVWLGKIADDGAAVDVAVVWPLIFGIHRDVDGVFFDEVLWDAVTGAAAFAGGSPAEGATGAQEGADAGRIVSLLKAGRSLPEWSFTLAVEPILLTQLRDLSDGFSAFDPSGVTEDWAADTAPAKDSAAVLSGLSGLAAGGRVEVITMPFSGASVDALASKGWRDGLQQVQLGKQVAQQILGLPGAISGVYPSDLDTTTAGLASYGQASVDHVVVRGSVALDLVEAPTPGAVTARVRDRDNQRVTLVFADEDMMSLMSSPWDAGAFNAGLAATLASGSLDGLVLTPAPGSGVPPARYVEAVGRALQRIDRLQTRKLSEFVLAHSPGTRPVLLDRESVPNSGYIAQELQAAVESAHQVVEDIVRAAGSAVEPVATAQAFLYTAQGLWWSLPQSGPAVASQGLAYADRARELATAELAKITGVALNTGSVLGSQGEVVLRVDNAAPYPVRVEVALSPRGLRLPGGERLTLDVPSGGVEVPLAVEKTDGGARLEVVVSTGSHVFGQDEVTVRFFTVISLLPWIVGFVVVVAVAGGVVYVSRRRRRARRAEGP